jgi:hypothetical protein
MSGDVGFFVGLVAFVGFFLGLSWLGRIRDRREAERARHDTYSALGPVTAASPPARPRGGAGRTVLRVVFAVASLGSIVAYMNQREGGSCDADAVIESVDDGRALWCIDGHYRELTCLGATGVHAEGHQVLCDQTLGRAGDVCIRDGAGACSVDHTQLLRCTDHAFVAEEACGGPGGCTVSDERLHCDGAVAVTR